MLREQLNQDATKGSHTLPLPRHVNRVLGGYILQQVSQPHDELQPICTPKPLLSLLGTLEHLIFSFFF